MERALTAQIQDNYTKVSTKDLLAKLKENRDLHRQEWEEAHGKWRELQIEKMKEYLQTFQRAIELADKGGKIAWPNKFDFILDEPQNHDKEYSRVISRLEMSVEDEVHISHNDFNKFVLDDWSWKDDFATVNSAYLGVGSAR